GETRIKRHDRSALLNMAQHLNVTRNVLEQTHRRSWRLIWEEEIQPGCPAMGNRQMARNLKKLQPPPGGPGGRMAQINHGRSGPKTLAVFSATVSRPPERPSP